MTPDMSPERWAQQARGDGCPFCAPRPDDNAFWSKVRSFSVSTLYLHKSQTYRGYSLLIFDPRHEIRPSGLTPAEWQAWCGDLHRAQAAIERVVAPDLVNVAALGNRICHLHWHIIPRFRDDPRWGAPIWTTDEKEMPDLRLSTEAHLALVDLIRAQCE